VIQYSTYYRSRADVARVLCDSCGDWMRHVNAEDAGEAPHYCEECEALAEEDRRESMR
jgi:hypothetical protein